MTSRQSGRSRTRRSFAFSRHARAVGIDRGDVERRLGAGIDRVVGEGGLDADAACRPDAAGSRCVASEAWPDGSLTPTVIEAFSACVVSGARGMAIVSVEWPCASVSGSVSSLESGA